MSVPLPRRAEAVQAGRNTDAEPLPAALAPPASGPRARGRSRDQLIGCLADLCELGEFTMIVSLSTDPEHADADVTVSLVAGGRRRVACRASLLEALRVVTAAEPVKTCTLCKRTLPLARFARNRTTNDGHVKRCRECEKARVGEYDRKYREVHGHKRLTK